MHQPFKRPAEPFSNRAVAVSIKLGRSQLLKVAVDGNGHEEKTW